MKKGTAFLFDLNGTMIDDMEYHLHVWYNIIVNELGASMTRGQVKDQMYGKSQEVLVRIFGADRFPASELDRISIEKEREYQRLYRPHLDLLPGLFNFLETAHEENIPMAIGSAAIPYNIDFVIDNLKLRHYFNAIVSADDVEKSKPHPETYLKAAALSGMDPSSCIVFEDAPMGVEAAYNAGMNAVVLTTIHEKHEFRQYPNIILFSKNYLDLSPSLIRRLHENGSMSERKKAI